MHDADVSAQERLQMQSLRNVRALVDKLEAEEREKKGLWLALAWALGIVVLLAALATALMKWGGPPKPTRAAVVSQTSTMTEAEFRDHVVRLVQVRANSRGEAASRSNREGRGIVRLEVKPSGYGDVSLVKGMGNSHVDSALTSLVKRAEPFGPIPRRQVIDLEVALVPEGKGVVLQVALAK